ncbi:MAG: ABC transporter ATP-binding protein [Clostridiaceae bacterium]
MGLLIKELKKYWLLVLVIIAALFLQAFSELSLPDYMAKIVNVGIQQGGIESSPPDILSSKTYGRMELVMNDTDKKTLNDSYVKASDEDITKLKSKSGFKEINTSDFMVLKDKSLKSDENLTKLISKGLMTVRFLDKGAPEGMNSQAPVGEMANFPKGDAAFAMLGALNAQQKEAMLSKIDSAFAGLPDSMVTQGAMNLVSEEYTSMGVDSGKIQNSYIVNTGIIMIGVALLALAASVLVGFIASRIAADLGMNLRNRFFDKVMNFSSIEFDKFSTASLITRSNNDIQQVQNMLVMLLRVVFYAPIMGVGGVIKALQTDVSMAWIIAAAVIVILILVGIVFYFAMPQFKKIQKMVDRLSLVTREILNGILVIRAFVTGEHEEKRFEKANRDLTETNQKIANVMITLNPVLMFLMNFVTITIIWVGANQVEQGHMMVGNMMAFMQYTMQILMSFLMITMVSIMLPRAQISLARVNEVLETEPSILDSKEPVSLPEKITGKIEFKNVSFRFHDAPEDILNNINLQIEPGKTTAFIGSTGSGKSTLINLIPRFYDVTGGSIEIDGVDIRDIPIKELRKHMGYVPQRANLFTGTVASNLSIGKNNGVTDEEMDKAIHIAQASDFIEKSGDGLDYEVVQGGTNVSGGQKQRLSIARALVGKPEILIFDDSFSALDFKTDLELRRSLANEYKGATILIVAQRIGTIVNADKIVVMDEGRISAVGTHDYLMKNSEIYEKIASSQIRKEGA